MFTDDFRKQLEAMRHSMETQACELWKISEAFEKSFTAQTRELRQATQAIAKSIEQSFKSLPKIELPQLSFPILKIDSVELEAVLKVLNSEPFLPGGTVDDLLWILGRDDWGDDSRMVAAQRIARRLGNVIYKKRWKWAEPKLRDLAKTQKVSERKALENLIVQRLFEVAQSIAHDTPSDWQESYEKLRGRLNELLTEDLLGSGWRRKVTGEEIDFEPDHESILDVAFPSLLAQIEARLVLERLISLAKLTNREREIFIARKLQDSSYDAISRKFKIETATARVLCRRAFNKIKKISKRP